MICPKCGKENFSTASFCEGCGEMLPQVENINAQQYNSQEQQQYQQPINNYLVFAILTTIFCCLPTGIVAIVYSSKVNNLLAVGNTAGALDAARKAKIWSIVSLCVGVLAMIINLLIVFGVLSSYTAANIAQYGLYN